MLDNDADIETPLEVAHNIANSDDFELIRDLIVVVFFVGMICEEELRDIAWHFLNGLIPRGRFASEPPNMRLIFLVDSDECEWMHGNISIAKFIKLMYELADGFGAERAGTLIRHYLKLS